MLVTAAALHFSILTSVTWLWSITPAVATALRWYIFSDPPFFSSAYLPEWRTYLAFNAAKLFESCLPKFSMGPRNPNSGIILSYGYSDAKQNKNVSHQDVD